MTEFKPKKAKFAFRFSLNENSFLRLGAEIIRVFGHPPADKRDWWLELDTNMNRSEIRIYIDNEAVYHRALLEVDNVNLAVKS